MAIVQEEFRRFRPDRLRAVEAGLRYGIPGRDDLDVAAALAYTRWTGIQADTIDNFAEPATANVGNARIYTLDLSLGWRPAPGVTIDAAAVFNDSKLKDLPQGIIADLPDGALQPPLPGVARFNGRIAGTYQFAAAPGLDLRLVGAARYVGRSNLGAGDFLRRPQGDWLDVGLRIEGSAGAHSFSVGVANLLDTAANRFALGSPFSIARREHTTPVRPRTFRAGWQIRF